MNINDRKEQFSNAYIRAVAAVAGFACYKPKPDIDSVDWCLATVGGKGTTRSPKVELQLKCTSRELFDDVCIKFPLKIKNYDELRFGNYQVPRILVVVAVPDDIADWLLHSEEELALRNCGYWVSLRAMDQSDNLETVTVHVPRAQQFTVDALTQMMERIGNGGHP
jgi:hypothetical protein